MKRAPQAPLPSRTPSPRVAIFVLVVTGFALLMVGRTDPAVFEGFRLRIMETLTPVLETASGPVRKVRSWRERMAERSEAFEDNQRLKAEIESLRANGEEARKNAYLVERYQALLNIQLDPRIDYVTGRIIADTGGPFMRTFVINAGGKEGVMVGQGVVDADGLIGRIVTVGKTSSRVLLLTDVKSRVPVLLRPSNIHAMLVGDNSPEPTLEYVPDSATAAPGDQVMTSGRGGLLPPNMPIGSVMPLDKTSDITRVKLAADFNKLDFVRVMRFSAPIDLDEPDQSGLAPVPTPMANVVKAPIVGKAAPAAPTPLASTQPASAMPAKTPGAGTSPGAAALPPPQASVAAPEPIEDGEDRGVAIEPDGTPAGQAASGSAAPAQTEAAPVAPLDPQGDIAVGGAVRRAKSVHEIRDPDPAGRVFADAHG